ncbi:MAG: hypothetical protein AMS24_02275 [Chlamydiae bacterium SM23_39]|nr:MAG: hypothetical protein AMS24_02275 [Chlamydiae bacterium SM23_39]
MEKIIDIKSFSNPKIKLIRELKKRNKREKSKYFIIEGYREIEKAYIGGYEIEVIFFNESLFLKNNELRLIKKINAKKNIRVLKNIFEKLSYRDRPEGLLAIAKKKQFYLTDLEEIIKKTKNPFFLILENIEKPGNLGSILRSADTAGVDVVIVCDPKTDIFNPNTIRASIGAVFIKKVIIAEKEEVLKILKKNIISIIATTPNSDFLYTEVDLKKPLALIFGSEQYGLSNFWLNNSDIKVKIPMKGRIDSLNVSNSVSILLYEVLRQRS